MTCVGNSSDTVILPGSQLPLTQLFVIVNVFVSWTTYVGNEQKILQNIAVNIMGTQMSDADATVPFIPEKIMFFAHFAVR
jgi:hypothetical protein